MVKHDWEDLPPQRSRPRRRCRGCGKEQELVGDVVATPAGGSRSRFRWSPKASGRCPGASPRRPDPTQRLTDPAPDG